MKISSISALSGLFALTSAELYTETVPVVCSGVPSTVTVTQTVTAGANNYPGGPDHHQTTQAPYVTTADGTVTSVAYDGASKSSVWVYPTGTGNKECTVGVYENDVVIKVIIIDINITINEGITTTETITKTDSATYTPTPPVIPPYSANSTTTLPPYSTGTSTPKIHHIDVGRAGLVYDPPQLDAAPGDILRFNFFARNHTVTQSNFATPCEFNGGFDTGFNQFNPGNTSDLITRDFTVKDNKPLWFYCAQTVPTSHCHAGMVLGVNPNGKFDAFLALAKSSGNSTSPSGTGVSSTPIATYSTKASGTGNSGSSSTASAQTTNEYKFPLIKGRSFQA